MTDMSITDFFAAATKAMQGEAPGDIASLLPQAQKLADEDGEYALVWAILFDKFHEKSGSDSYNIAICACEVLRSVVNKMFRRTLGQIILDQVETFSNPKDIDAVLGRTSFSQLAEEERRRVLGLIDKLPPGPTNTRIGYPHLPEYYPKAETAWWVANSASVDETLQREALDKWTETLNELPADQALYIAQSYAIIARMNSGGGPLLLQRSVLQIITQAERLSKDTPDSRKKRIEAAWQALRASPENSRLKWATRETWSDWIDALPSLEEKLAVIRALGAALRAEPQGNLIKPTEEEQKLHRILLLKTQESQTPTRTIPELIAFKSAFARAGA